MKMQALRTLLSGYCYLRSYATLQTTDFFLVLQATLHTHSINYYHRSVYKPFKL